MADFIAFLVYGLGSEEVQHVSTVQYVDMLVHARDMTSLRAVVDQACF
jgi:hypothetical protein